MRLWHRQCCRASRFLRTRTLSRARVSTRPETRTAHILEVLVIDHVERPSTSQSQGAAPATLPQYQDVSVKLDQDGTTSLRTGAGVIRQRVQIIPGEFHGTNNSLREMIRMAYGIKDYQIFGAPDWLSTDLYDIDAKSQDAAIAALKKLPEDQRETAGRAMLQEVHSPIASRSNRISKLNSYPRISLVVLVTSTLHAATGSCDPPAPGPRTLSNNAPPCGQIADYLPGQLTGAKASVPQLANSLSNITGRPVQDKTNLTAKYDIHLSWDSAVSYLQNAAARSHRTGESLVVGSNPKPARLGTPARSATL